MKKKDLKNKGIAIKHVPKPYQDRRQSNKNHKNRSNQNSLQKIKLKSSEGEGGYLRLITGEKLKM